MQVGSITGAACLILAVVFYQNNQPLAGTIFLLIGIALLVAVVVYFTRQQLGVKNEVAKRDEIYRQSRATADRNAAGRLEDWRATNANREAHGNARKAITKTELTEFGSRIHYKIDPTLITPEEMPPPDSKK